MMGNQEDMPTLLLGLLRELRESVDNLSARVHTLHTDNVMNRNDYTLLNARVVKLEAAEIVKDEKLRRLEPVAAVLEKMKQWIILGFAIFFMGGIFLVGGLYIWSKIPKDVMSPMQVVPPPPAYTDPPHTPSSPPHRNQKTQTATFIWSGLAGSSTSI